MNLRPFICFIFLGCLTISRGQIEGCPKGQWQCDDGSCITAAWRCDGEGDCLDGSDEMDCGASAGSDCPPGQFSCLDSVGCVNASARCDGQIQCPTGSDEENCPVTEACQDSDWMCKNHICILKELRCNRQNDCIDNSDEEDCGLCRKNGVRCPEGTCLSAEERCDGQIHCSDGSDEPITCGRICSMSNGGCSHTCSDEPWGVLCTCPVGYKLAPNGAVCEDVNECESPFTPCVHHCTNTIGSYYCHCKEGFKLDGRSTCLASGNRTRLLMVQWGTVGLLTVKSQQFDSITTSVFDPVALAFDIARGWFYWADSQGNIYKSNGRYSWTAFAGEPGIRSLAYDWLNGYLFWTNQKTESIYMQAADGKSYTTLLNKNIRPSELVLLPVESMMIWINEGSGDRMTIEKSWMDGSDRSTLTVITAQSAHSLSADVAARRLYWISDIKKSVETVKVDGTGRYSFTGLFNKRPALSLAVFASMFYWIDNKGLWQAPQNIPTQRKFLWKAELPLLAVFHELQQPQGSSACFNSLCSFCQLTKSDPSGFICACPHFKVLMPDETCQYPRFIYATIATINLLEFRGRESTEIQLFATDDGILSFDVDWGRDWLYWTNQTGHIQRTSLTQVKTKVIQTPLPVCLINVDQRTGNLYWVTCDENNIGTITVGSNYPQRLYHTTKEIRSLFLDWLRGGVFWLEEEQIFSMDMLGGKATEMLQIAGGVRGNMAFDIRASSLLWNSERGGLTTLSLLQEKSHQAGKRWNISGSIIAAFEPYLLSISDDVMTLWDRRDGSPIQDVTVRGRLLCVIAALGDIQTVPNSPVCSLPSLLCRHSSVCLPQAQLCDGKKDCPDGDDEESCVVSCQSEDDFKCKDHSSCIPSSLLCDGRSHCRDGSDEVNCPTVASPVTRENVLKCRSGSKPCADGSECVLYSHVCDGEEDCEDGSDELGCDVAEITPNIPVKNEPLAPVGAFTQPPTKPPCTSPSVQCPGSSLCLKPSQMCDGKLDCPDGSDEKCVKRCSDTDFRCKDRRSCIPKSQVCDGRSHCNDGSDEVGCSSAALPETPTNVLKCRFGSRLCRDGTECVLLTHVCDGERDCPDGSDEEGCDGAKNTPPISAGKDKMNETPKTVQPFTQPPTKPPCTSPSVQCPGSSLCIKPSQMCDGRRDCPDGSDEKCVKRCPSDTDFRCKDRRSCVSKSQVCDGRSDCYDGSDEVGCPSVAAHVPQKDEKKCRFGSRLCRDGTECVLLTHVCDGERDCPDGSDEEGCDGAKNTPPISAEKENMNESPKTVQPFTQPPTKPPCTSPSVQCPGSSLCIKPSQMCDGRRDCPDGSDEKCVKRCPSDTDLRCKDRRSCVSKSQVCDGRSDCYDGSDEVGCPSVAAHVPQKDEKKCRFGSRLCRDGTECVLLTHVCDGERDCPDGSDEEGCDGAKNTPPISAEKDKMNESPKTVQPFTQPPTKPPCTSPSVQCPGSSVCIKPSQMCDGRRDCPDGSDEKCVKRCPSDTDFRCKDRRSCVSAIQVCDGRSHCHDGSDEVGCPSAALPETPTNVLKCRFGSRLCQDGTECVLLSHICDGEIDCQDGSDEEGCDDYLLKDGTEGDPNIAPTKPPCTSPSVQCPGSSLCIKPSQMCDGRRDCPDGSDEKCVKRCPSDTDFRCKDRRSCISNGQVCDGRSDCHDSSDEVGCPSVAARAPQKDEKKCRFGSRLCRDGTECVLLTHVCDGERDCPDGSDEEGCDGAKNTPISAENNMNESPKPVKAFTQPPTKPPCTSPSVQCPGSSVCLKPSQMCDGRRDCPDGSDEKCVKRCPSDTDFRCKDRRSCVSKSQVCNGRSDCHDSSDEVGCPSVPPPEVRTKVLKCLMGSWPCQDGTECVLFSHVCDGETDCQDGSDEEGCDAVEMPSSSNKPSCSFPSVQCPDSDVCVTPTQFCDGKRDCPDGSDENCLKKCFDNTGFLCKDRRSCISKKLVCDGHSHCYDGSDEINCPSVTTSPPQANVLKCRMGSKPCNDGKECVLYNHVCDGEKDCMDGSDEEGCQETCKQGEFQCSHGNMCIPEAEVCDGKYQCRDQSDEFDCWQKTKSCEFRCADGKRCIPKKFLCDGERDCMDGTDELGCDSDPAATAESPIFPSTPACVTPSVLCPGSSLCVSQSQLCDGQKDCPDGFDENNCVVKCENPGDFLCSDKRKCVPSIHVCDGRAHCPDGSDEKQCESSATSTSNVPNGRSGPLRCLKGFKPCKDGLECVMYSHVCDGEKDCKDGSDEEGCRSRCKAGEFQCAHGNRCIPQELVCDGQNDCQDRSDEMDCLSQSEGCHQRCDNNTRCIPKTFLCDGERDCVDGSDEEKCGLVACGFHQYRCASGQCVSEALRCDGYPDCSDRSDEVDCRRPPRCPSQLRCPHSHECLQKDWLCDGEEDCKDGSDEKNCITPPKKCRTYQWQCGNGRWCIPLSWRCDGKEDCHDGKDEDKCSQRKCPSHLYQCGSGECLDPSLVCNGRINCADSSDEGVGCAQRNCSSPSAPRCDHHCVSTPNGPRCYCTVGFMPQPITKSCVDLDECHSAPDPVCKHLCLNTPGSYSCHCHPGFYLEPDNKSCKTKDEPLLLASLQSELLLLRVHSGTLELFASINRPVSSLDYHWAQQRVYWLSTNYQSIRWADLSNSNKGILMKGLKSNSIAVDWVGGNLYWLDGLAGQILAAKLSNVMVRSEDYTVVLGENLQQPNSLLLLPDRGLMLWSEIGSTPQIEQSGMDGSKRKVVVSQDLGRPVSLAFDLLDNRVYWADEKLHCIGSASLDGDDIKILQLAETPSPISVAVFNDRVFWSDSKRKSIRSADKKTGKNQKVLLKRPGQPFGLKLMHALSQPEVSSPCKSLRCSHLCLLAPGDGGKSRAGSPAALAAVCRCPTGLLLSQDKITCSLPKESSFILLLSHNTVYQIYLRSMSRDGVALGEMPNGRYFALPGSEEPLGLDLSIPELSLFVADSRRGSVDMLRLSSSGSQPGLALAGQILKLKDDTVTALAVDWVTSNLYWSSNKWPDIYVTSRYNGYTTSLQQGSLMGTTSIALHPPSGRLCYIAAVMAGRNSQMEVDCAWMNGWNKAVVWRKSSFPVSLIFSNTGTVIYWADSAEGVIASVGVDGSGYKQFKTGSSLLVSLAYIENIFLWTTQDKDATKLWFSDGLQPKQLWFETKTKVVDVRAYNDDSQSGTNSCSKNNGECGQLCLPNPEGRTCKCGRGFYYINATSCAPLPSCPTGEESCFDGSQCITSTKFCDGRADCPDKSDEQDCRNSNSASPRTKVSDGRSPQSPSSPYPKNQKNSVLSDKNSASCDSKYCSGHGTCITEGQLTRCQCATGYKGEFCQEQDRQSHPALILGSFSLVAGVIVAAFILSKRKGWAYFRSKSPDKETLMGNMVLPGEHDSDSEELESSVDVRSPLRAIKSLQLK